MEEEEDVGDGEGRQTSSPCILGVCAVSLTVVHKHTVSFMYVSVATQAMEAACVSSQLSNLVSSLLKGLSLSG